MSLLSEERIDGASALVLAQAGLHHILRPRLRTVPDEWEAMEYRPKSRGKDKRCTSEAKVNTSEIASEADIEHLLHIPEIFVVPPTDELRPASAWTQFPVDPVDVWCLGPRWISRVRLMELRHAEWKRQQALQQLQEQEYLRQQQQQQALQEAEKQLAAKKKQEAQQGALQVQLGEEEQGEDVWEYQSYIDETDGENDSDYETVADVVKELRTRQGGAREAKEAKPVDSDSEAEDEIVTPNSSPTLDNVPMLPDQGHDLCMPDIEQIKSCPPSRPLSSKSLRNDWDSDTESGDSDDESELVEVVLANDGYSYEYTQANNDRLPKLSSISKQARQDEADETEVVLWYPSIPAMTFPRWGPLPPIDEEDESEWSSETESESDDDQSQSEVSEVLDCDDSDTNSALFDALFTPSSKPWADFEDENDVQWPEEWSLSDSECGNHPGWSLPLSRIRAV